MKAALYARVSTEDQIENSSITTQLQAMRNHAEEYGMQVLSEFVDAGISGSLLSRPQLDLLRDEPSLGLAPMVIGEIFEVLRKINQEQKTSLLIAEQNAITALSIADYGYILQNGRVVLDGPALELKGHQQVKHSYLGFGTAKDYYETKSSKLRGQEWR